MAATDPLPWPPPNNPRVVSVKLLFHRDTRILINSFHVLNAAPWTMTDIMALATAVHTWYTAQYKATLPQGVGLFQIQIRKLDPANPLAYDLGISPDELGTINTAMEAGNVTVTMSFRTGLAGRAYRGRMYVIALAEADVSQSDLVSSGRVAVLGLVAYQLILAMTNAGYSLCIFHRPHQLPWILDNQFTIVTSAVIDSIVDSQRRRLPGRGR